MALKFLKESDFDGILAPSVLSSLKGQDSKNLIDAESLALSELDPLKSKYAIDAMLDKKDADRHKVLIRIIVNITAYFLYNTVPDDEIPQRIADNWKKELKGIADLSSGKSSSTLDVLTDETTGQSVTNFRWGSNKKRSHGMYF